MKRLFATFAIVTLVLCIGCSKDEATTTASAPAPDPASASTPESDAEASAGDEGSQTAQEGEVLSATSTAISEADIADAPRIEPQRAWELVQSGQAVILDVRSKEQFDADRIEGSQNIPLWDLEKRARSELDSTKWVITACT